MGASSGNDIVPIAGIKRVQYLDENLAAGAVRLSSDDLARIKAAIPLPSGDRYDPLGMRSVGL